MSQKNSSNNKIFPDFVGKNGIIPNQHNLTLINLQNEFNILCQTPIKQNENNPNNNLNLTPFHFDFNYYFGNLWSTGKIPNNQIIDPNINTSPPQLGKENNIFYKKSMDKTYKLTPLSPFKNSNSQNSNNDSNNSSSNNNILLINNNDNMEKKNKIENVFDNNNNDINSYNELSKKNLCELFNNVKNEQFLYDMNNNNNNFENNIINLENKENIPKNIDIKKKNCNLQISHPFVFSSPRIIKKPKKIFECSGSTIATYSSNGNKSKKRRFRKNSDQLTLLKNFYKEHKFWSKNQIKEISQKTGLKENKVYKWLWDQKNKELKATKFVVDKDNSS